MHKSLLTIAIAALLLAGCSTDPEQSRAVPVEVPTTPGGDPVTKLGPTANFDPSTGVVPTPNNLVYAGSADGTLNLPVADATDFGDPLVAINALDGWSTVAPMVTTFSEAVDPATVVPGSGVRIFEVTLSGPGPGGAVTGVTRELTPGAEFVAVMATATTLAIVPTAPLAEKSHYAVVLTDAIADAEGGPIQASQIYAIIKNTEPLVDEAGASTTVLPDANAQALEPLRQLTNAREAAVAAAAGIDADRIRLSWTVSTQSVTDVIDWVAANVEPAANVFAATGQTTAAVGGGGAADIYIGTIDLPYGLQAPADDPANPDPTRILSGHWTGAGGSNLTRFNPAVAWRGTQTVPVLMTIPNGASGHAIPAEGWPIVVFQHGITGDRTHMLAIADAAAGAGRAVIAIDQPLHGVTDTTSPFYGENGGGFYALVGTVGERHFDVDLVDNATGAPGADGTIDGSGTHTINLPSLLTSRDNLRQAAADLLAVIATVGDINAGGPTFDPTAVAFVGHSLGAIVGTQTLGATDQVASATLAMPGGGIARMLDASPTFSQRIRDGLAAAGVAYPSAEYDQFMFAAQTVIDSADPINHAVRAAANTPIHMIEVVGDGTDTNLPDQVVPNTAAGAPLSGTEPLAAVMGLQAITETTMDTAGVRGIVRFTEGDHGSILSPAASGPATVEMQTQMATFMASFGTMIPVTDDSVVLTP